MYGPRGNLQKILCNIYMHNQKENNSPSEDENLSLLLGINSEDFRSANNTMTPTAMLSYVTHDSHDSPKKLKMNPHCTDSLLAPSNANARKRRRLGNDSNSSFLTIPFTMKRVKWSFLFVVFLVVIPHINGEPPIAGNNWDRPLGMPKITQLEVMCGAQHMEVHLTFDAPFHGLVASKGMYGHEGCVYVPPRTGRNNFVFNIYYDKCGTKPDNHGKFYENTVVVQYDEELIEAWDEAKRLRCEWFNDYEKTATKTSPMVISDLDIVELNFHGDNVDCWMEIQEGKGPWAPPLNGIVPLGSPLTMVVAVKDPTGEFDMRVKACEASDGHGGHSLQLSDPEGCIVRPKLLGRFSKIKLDDGRATVLTYAYISAFKFPDMLNVHLRCTVEICRHGCPDHCASKYGAAANTNLLEGQHTLLEPMAHENKNAEKLAVAASNINDITYEDKPKPQSQEDLQLLHQKRPLNSEEAIQGHIQQQFAEPSIGMTPPPPPQIPLQHQGQGFPLHQNPHFPQRPFQNRPLQQQQQIPIPPQLMQQQRPQQGPHQQRPMHPPQGFPRPHPGQRPHAPPQGHNQQQFPPRPFLKQHPGGIPLNQQRFPQGSPQPPPGHQQHNGRRPNLGGNSFEIVQSIPTHSSEVRQEHVNPRNNDGQYEVGVSSSSPRPEEIEIVERHEGGKKEQREALMKEDIKEDRQGHDLDGEPQQNNDERVDSHETISVANFPKGPRNLRVRRSVDSSSDVIGVQGAFRVISQADLDFVLNSTSTNEFSASSPVLRGKMSRPEEAIYGICLPKVGFGVVFFGLGFSTLVAIIIAAFLAYARYQTVLYKNGNSNIHAEGPIGHMNNARLSGISQCSYHAPSFPMVILRKMW